MTTKFKLIKQVTKKWKSGITTFSVISDNEHIDRNYIILDRKLIGKSDKNQFFNLRFQDWTKLNISNRAALDEITKLLKMKVLKKAGKGRSLRYEIA